MQVRTKALEGAAVRWDGANADELAALAGNSYEGTYASDALVRNRDGDLVHVRPGWVVVVWGGAGEADVYSAGAWRAQVERVP